MRGKSAFTVIGLLTAAAVCYAVFLSLDPENYVFPGDGDRASWSWNPIEVTIVCGIMIAGGGLLAAVFRLGKPERLWLRSLFALIVIVAWTTYAAAAFVHMPAYVAFHQLWLLTIACVLLIAGFLSLIRSARRALGQGRRDGR